MNYQKKDDGAQFYLINNTLRKQKSVATLVVIDGAEKAGDPFFQKKNQCFTRLSLATSHVLWLYCDGFKYILT